MALKKANAKLSASLARHESDARYFMSKEINEVKLELTTQIGDLNRQATKLRLKEKVANGARDIAVTDLANALLAFETETSEHKVAMLKTKEASERQRDNAVAVKERVIANRDEKLRVLTIEAKDQAALYSSQAELHSDALAALETVNAERLMTIKRMAGKLGGRPHAPRTEEELGELRGRPPATARSE